MPEKNNIVDFTCIMVRNEVDSFARTNVLPPRLTDGDLGIIDIQRCLSHMDSESQNIARHLIEIFIKNQKRKYGDVSKEYIDLYENLETRSSRFCFARVMDNFRTNVNPVVAFYYECREMKRSWNPKNPYHLWLLYTVQDREFHNNMIEAITHDLEMLSKYMNLYYWPFVTSKKEFAIEVYHAKQLIEDFEGHIEFFADLLEWSPPT